MATDLYQVAEGFSLSHAQILDGNTAFESIDASDVDYDIYGVNDGSLDPNVDEYINQGDDVDLSTWNWLNRADVKVQAGYISFPLISTMTGHDLSTSSSGASTYVSVDLWHEDEANMSGHPMVLQMPSKDAHGNVKLLTIGLYRVNFAPITFDGPKFKDGLKVNYAGKAVYSPVDELGQTFSDGKKRVGKLILSTPA